MKAFVLHEPMSLIEAAALGSCYGYEGAFLAGGTDLVVQMNRHKKMPAHVIDLSRLPGLSEIDRDESGYTIGSLTTHKAIERHAGIRNEIAMLAEAASVVGGHQIRNIATIGGNVINASPAADAVVPLLALDAQLTFVCASGSRHLPLRDFLSEDRNSRSRFGEVLTGITIPRSAPRTGTAFLKAGRRAAMEISIVSVACLLKLDRHGRILAAAIALGSVGSKALRCPISEALLAGCHPGSELFRDVANTAAKECSPISDTRASAAYRLILIVALVERALAQCAQLVVAKEVSA